VGRQLGERGRRASKGGRQNSHSPERSGFRVREVPGGAFGSVRGHPQDTKELRLPAQRPVSLQDLKQHPFAGLTETSPLFAADQKEQMSDWISDVLLQRPDPDYVAALDSGALKVSKNLFATVARESTALQAAVGSLSR
jgi:hypothetical protein